MGNQDQDDDGLDAARALRLFEDGRLLPRAEAEPHLRALLETRIDQLGFRLMGTKAPRTNGGVVRIPGERA